MRSIEIKDLSEDFIPARQYVRALLRKNGIADSVVSETLLIFEALCHSIFEQREDSSAAVKIEGRMHMGGYVTITFGFEGGVYVSNEEKTTDLTPEDRILQAYADKIDYTYYSGYNRIVLTVRRGSIASVLPCLLGVLLAFAICIPLHFYAEAELRNHLAYNLVSPLQVMLSNAVMMVGAPVTFFSFLKNLTDTYAISETRSEVRKLQNDIFLSSAISVLLAILTSLLLIRIVTPQTVSFADGRHLDLDLTMREFIRSLLPSDIFTPFQTFSPFPLILVAVIVAYALCSTGKYFNRMKDVINVCYALFSRMLSIVMYALPFMLFIALMTSMLTRGFVDLKALAVLLLTVIMSTSVMIAFYGIRLRLKGVPVLPFIKKLRPLLIENFRISSAIDAAPYNIRYCAKVYGMDRRKLEVSIPVLAQINLDGNCFFLTMITLLTALNSNSNVTFIDIITIGVLVFFLSLGAPNQPGSCLIGILVILNYMDSLDLIPMAVIAEVSVGWLLNLTNIVGDLVTVADKESVRHRY